MKQGELDFGREARVTDTHRAVLRAVGDAVDALGLLVAAGACGCRTSELADALAGREHRYLRIEWVLAILDVARPDDRRAIANALLGGVGMRAEPARPLTPEERLAQLERTIAARFGAAGVELIEENRR